MYIGVSNAQWIQTNGPYGGGVYSFATSGTNLFAGTNGGVYLSTDNGTSWGAVNNGLPGGCYGRALLVSGANLFVGTWGKGIFRSTDNGASWVEAVNGVTNFTVYCFASVNSNLFVGTANGVFRSRDNGANWTWLSSGWVAFPDVRALSSNNETIFAATWFGKVYRSTNDGIIWTDVTNGLNGSFTALGSSGTSTFVGNYSGRIYRTTNNGNSWIEVSSGLTLGNPINGFAVIDSIIYAATRAGVYLSTNNGDNWILSSNGLPSNFLGTIGVNPNGTSGTDLLVSSNYSLHSIYRSTNNGTSWTYSDSGLIATGVGTLAVNNSYIFAGAGGTGLFRTTNNGEDWIEINNGLTDTRLSALVVKENYIFAGTWGGGVFRSSDDGTNWMPVNQGLNNQVLSLEVQGHNIFAGTYGSGIFRSTDNGSSWIPVNNGFPSGGVVFAIAATDEYIFAGSFVAAGVGGVYRSTDGGNSWTQVVNGLTDYRISVLAFAANNLFAGTLDAFGAGGSGIYRTTDYGANWTPVSNGLTNLTINTLYSVNGTTIFAGTGEGGSGGVPNTAGIFRSTDNGNNWIQVNDGLWNTVVSAFIVSGDNLFIGAEGGGVWRRPLSEIMPTTTFQLSVSVANGWNMVSIPGLNTPDQNVNTWWAFRDPGASVFKYAGGYQPITDATPGLGYWMKHTGALTYNTGEEWPAGGIQSVAHTPLTGASGWNLIGGYELSVGTVGVTTNPPGLQSGPIYKYSGGYAVATTLDPGYGYWMKLTAAGQIIIPETMAKRTEPVEYFPEDWGRIILTDATGVNYTLYAVKGEVDLSQYELPPAPMEGMYDFRFSSGRIAEDLNSGVKTIEMSGVVYPLTVMAEGMDIRLMDETGKTINVNLKSGEDVVISDASVMKLMVTGEWIPAVYALEQNYPNPFNPSTTIKFSLAAESKVNLKVFNTLGQEVAELLNGNMIGGTQSLNFDATKLSSGVYLYRIVANGIDGTNFISVKKMILIK